MKPKWVVFFIYVVRNGCIHPHRYKLLHHTEIKTIFADMCMWWSKGLNTFKKKRSTVQCSTVQYSTALSIFTIYANKILFSLVFLEQYCCTIRNTTQKYIKGFVTAIQQKASGLLMIIKWIIPTVKNYMSHTPLRFKSTIWICGRRRSARSPFVVGKRKMSPRQTTFPKETKWSHTASGSSFSRVRIGFILDNKIIKTPASANLMVLFPRQAGGRTRPEREATRN